MHILHVLLLKLVVITKLLFLPKFYKNLLYIGWVSKNLMCKCANSLEMPILVLVFFFFENYTLFDSFPVWPTLKILVTETICQWTPLELLIKFCNILKLLISTYDTLLICIFKGNADISFIRVLSLFTSSVIFLLASPTPLKPFNRKSWLHEDLIFINCRSYCSHL